MARAYQYDASGYYAGEIEDHGLLPNNATHTPPKKKEGHIPHWTGEKWEQVENHKGESGYVNGEPFTIKDYGPYPKGWSTELPEKTAEEKKAEARAMRDGLLAETDYLMMPDYPLAEKTKKEVTAYRQALRDITGQPGFPGSVVWPEKPRGV